MKFVCISIEGDKYFLVSTKPGEVVNPKVEITKEVADELLQAGVPVCN
jgi:hypothetical protein